jgi:hypothetical protein
MTEGSIKRLKKAIQLLIAISEPKQVKHFKTDNYFTFRIGFITLTLPAEQGELTDNAIKKQALEPWIRAMRDKYQMRSYVWKAERQMNGNLHFHITTDTWIPYYRIRDEWNKQMSKLGLIAKFEAKHGHSDPNSTDVHSVSKIKNLPGYLIKYMAKKALTKYLKPTKPKKPNLHPDNIAQAKQVVSWIKRITELQPIEGKMWDCSANLKCQDKLQYEMGTELDQWFDKVRQAIPQNVKTLTMGTFIHMTEAELYDMLPDNQLVDYLKYLNKVRGRVVSPSQQDGY